MSPRTPKPDGRGSRQNAARTTSLNPRRGPRRERPRYLVIGEGLTEVGYFKGLRRRGLHLEVIELNGRDHVGIVKAAGARRSDDYDAIWCVLDTELDPELTSRMLDAAEAGGVRLALSAPCFDFWLLLHHVDHRRPFQHAGEVEKELKRLLPGWTKGRTSFQDFAAGLCAARQRARQLPTGPRCEERLSAMSGGLWSSLKPDDTDISPGLLSLGGAWRRRAMDGGEGAAPLEEGRPLASEHGQAGGMSGTRGGKSGVVNR
ncbi:hypothetical protein GCM10022221_08830 [Actinocorallia aurea]